MESCLALQRLHRLPDERVILAQQNPEVIDQGVFHCDVIAVGNLDVFFFHEEAFASPDATMAEIRRKYEQATGASPRLVRVSSAEVPVGLAVSTYLFNSQLVTLPTGRTILVCPAECEENSTVRAYIAGLVSGGGDAPIDGVRYVDLRQSMNGGGGPACLRLRVALTEREERAIAPGVVFSAELDGKLVAWIERHYRDRLRPSDLADSAFLLETQTALDELTKILSLGSIYPFQL
jgi:succinylarginine dihydrolase